MKNSLEKYNQTIKKHIMKQSSKEIQKMFMSMPISETMKNYIRHTGWQFTDSHIATLLYNFPFPYFVTRELLEAIHDNTEDETLKKQLEQRFEVDDLKLEWLKQSMKNTVFTVKSFDLSEMGTFDDYDSAMESVKDFNDEFSIEKTQVLSEGAEPSVQGHSFPLRNMDAENQTDFWDFDSAPETLGAIYFNEEKLIHRFWTITSDNEYIRKVDNLDSSRFENAFVPLPNPFEKGDKVQRLSTGETVVINTSKEQFNDTIARAEKNAAYDYNNTYISFKYNDGEGEKDDLACLFELERV